MTIVWNDKVKLPKDQVYGKNTDLIDDRFIYFDDFTCVEIDDQKSITYYKLVNLTGFDLPLYKYKKIEHREDGPSNISWYNNGQKREEKYVQNSKFYRKDTSLPSKIKWYQNGQKSLESCYSTIKKDSVTRDLEWHANGNMKSDNWYKNSLRHRDGNEPAHAAWYSNGQKSSVGYFINEKIHRADDKPAYSNWYSNGQKMSDEYYLNGLTHRINKPAYIKWYSGGIKKEESYYLNNSRHRDNDEFAIIEWNNKKEITYKRLYRNGSSYKLTLFQKLKKYFKS